MNLKVSGFLSFLTLVFCTIVGMWIMLSDFSLRWSIPKIGVFLLIGIALSEYFRGPCEPTSRNFLLALISIVGSALIIKQGWDFSRGTGLQLEYSAIGRLLPWSDAGGYYGGAHGLLEFGRLGDWTARRPLASVFWSILLGLTDRNLYQAIALSGLAVGISIWFLCVQVASEKGLLVGSFLAFAILIAFGNIAAGIVMSETPGFVVGCMGTAALIRGCNHQRRLWFFWGIYLIGIALGIRAGMMIFLPALVLLSFFLFSTDSRVRTLDALAAMFAVAAAMLTPLLVVRIVGPQHSLLMGNFASTLYGLAKGGVGWQQAYIDLAYAKHMSDADSNREFYRAAFSLIWENPLPFLKAILLHTAYSIVRPHYYGLTNMLVLILYQASALASLMYFYWKDKRAFLFGSAFFLSAVASAPFLHDGGWRAYSATVPLALYFAALPIGIILEFLMRANHKTKTDSNHSPLETLSLGWGVLLIILFVAVPVHLRNPELNQAKFGSRACPEGQKRAVIRNTEGSEITVVADSSKTDSRIPVIRRQDYAKGASAGIESWNEFQSIENGSTLQAAFDAMDGRIRYIVFPKGLNRPPKDPVYLDLCNTVAANGLVEYVNSWQTL